MQFPVGDATVNAGIVALPQDRGLLRPARQVPVDAVVRGVERSVLIPGDMHIALEGRILHLGKWLDPIDALCLLAPEAIGIGERLSIKPEIIVLADLADLRVGRDRDQGPACHGSSSSAGDAAMSPNAAEGYSARLRLYNTPSRLIRVSGGPTASSRGSRSMPPGSGLPRADVL